MTVTVPGANGSVIAIPSESGDILSLAVRISALLVAAEQAANLSLQVIADNGAIPAPAPSASGNLTDLTFDGAGGLNVSVPGYQFVADADAAPDTIQGTNLTLVTGTVGGTFNLSGNSTLAATGGNNAVTAAGNYLLSFGAGSNAVVAGGTGIIATDAGSSTIAGFGANTVSLNGTNDIVVAADGTTTVIANGQNARMLGNGGALFASILGANATVSAATSDTNVTISGSAANVLGGSGTAGGALGVVDRGTADTIATFNSTGVISDAGANTLLFGGTAPVAATITGGNDTVVGQAGPMTVDAASAVQIFGGTQGTTGPLSFVGGAATSTILGGVGGAEALTVGGGGVVLSSNVNNVANIAAGGNAGLSVIFGGYNSTVNFNEAVPNGTGGAIFDAGGGNETMNAQLSNATIVMSGGGAVLSNVSLVGGAGNNTFFAGAGVDTLVGGAGTNAFAFFHGVTTGQADYIANFTTKSSLYVLNYGGPTTAESLIANAVSTGSGMTMTLSDNTTITFTDIHDKGTLQSTLAGRFLYS